MLQRQKFSTMIDNTSKYYFFMSSNLNIISSSRQFCKQQTTCALRLAQSLLTQVWGSLGCHMSGVVAVVFLGPRLVAADAASPGGKMDSMWR